MREEQFYGGSAQEAEDSRRLQQFLNQHGELVVRREPGKIILSYRVQEEMDGISRVSTSEIGAPKQKIGSALAAMGE